MKVNSRKTVEGSGSGVKYVARRGKTGVGLTSHYNIFTL